MPLAYVGTSGGQGRINDDLTITHVGGDGLDESVEAYVEDVEAGAETVDEAFDTLMLELPLECEVREIRRIRDDR